MERRRHVRINIEECPALLAVFDGQHHVGETVEGFGEAMDLSEGGFRVKADVPLAKGAHVDLTIELPAQAESQTDGAGSLDEWDLPFTPVSVCGEICWTSPDGTAGVRILDMAWSDRHALCQYVHGHIAG